MASSSSSFSSTSVYLNAKQRVLSKQQIDALVSHLDALDHGKVLKLVKDDVGSGHHLNFFQDRRTAWSAVVLDRKFEPFVSSVIQKYIALIRQCCAGREKYSNLFSELDGVCTHYTTPS